jgi:hypothetical protein
MAGGIIVSRLLAGEFSPAGLVMAVVFVAFALYRLNTAARRYREYRQLRSGQGRQTPV